MVPTEVKRQSYGLCDVSSKHVRLQLHKQEGGGKLANLLSICNQCRGRIKFPEPGFQAFKHSNIKHILNIQANIQNIQNIEAFQHSKHSEPSHMHETFKTFKTFKH